MNTNQELFNSAMFRNHFEHRKNENDYSFDCECPICGAEHKDQKLHIAYSADQDKILMHCFRCSAEMGQKASYDAILNAIGLTASDLNPSTRNTIITSYAYKDINGNVIATKTKSYKKGNSKGKSFKWTNSLGKNQLGADKDRLLLYNADRLHNATDNTVLFAEGEKDADTLCRLGYIATTLPNGGSATKWEIRYNQFVEGKEVIILTDNDVIGNKYGVTIAKAINGIAKSVKIIPSVEIYQNIENKADITDIYNMLGREQTIKLLNQAIAKAKELNTSNISELEQNNILPYYYKQRDNNNFYVHPSLLSEYYLNLTPYKIVRSAMNNQSQLFRYENGIYKYISTARIEGDLKELILHPNKTFIGNEYLKASTISESTKLTLTSANSIDIELLDADESIINYLNGVLHIDNITGELTFTEGHSADNLCTIQIPCNYRTEPIQTPYFDKFLNDLIPKEEQNTVLEYIALCISNIQGWRTKQTLFLEGKADCGKSVLVNLIKHIVGNNNTFSFNIATLDERFQNDCYCKRLGVSGDNTESHIKSFKNFKHMTGGDSITLEQKGKEGFKYTFKGVLICACNHLPYFSGNYGKEVYRRILPIVCNDPLPLEQRNSYLLEYLCNETEGIVQKVIPHLQRLIKNKLHLTMTKGIAQRIEEYKENNSPVIEFFNRYCKLNLTMADDIREYNQVNTSDFYRAYTKFCLESGVKPVSKKNLYSELADHTELKNCRGSKNNNALRYVGNGTEKFNFYCKIKMLDDFKEDNKW